MPRLRFVLAGLLLCLSLSSASAQSLRWAARGDALSMDPHAVLEGVSFNLTSLVYDSLVMMGRDGVIEPALATSWTLVSPTVWRFELRRGVLFQDGTPFTADDVVFSIDRAQQPPSEFAVFAAPLGRALRIDDHTVELRQAEPDPLLLEHLRSVLIMSRAWATAHDAAHPPDRKAGQALYTSRHAMGTGRFTLQSCEPGVRTVLGRNPAWWGRFDGNVQQVEYRPIASDATRTAALLAGDIDFMQDVPPQNGLQIAATPGLQLLKTAETRLIYLGFDVQRDELLYSSVKGRNPFKDARVREALGLAIDADVLRLRTMRGESQPTRCAAATAASCLAPPFEAPTASDLPKARRLLAEAGYPKGFEVTLDCPNDRYVNDQALCLAIGAMLAKIDVTVKVDARSKTLFMPKVLRADTSFFLFGFGTSDAQPLLDAVAHSVVPKTGHGSFNLGRIADAELDRWIDDAGREMNVTRRNELIARAQQRVGERRLLLPIHRQMLVWAARAKVHPVISPENQVHVEWIRVE